MNMNRKGLHLLLLLALGSVFSGAALTACNPEEIVLPEPPAFVTLSGRVIALPLLAPLADATVALEDGSVQTSIGPDGTWTLPNVPAAPDPLIKVTAPGDPFNYPPAYNSVPVSLGFLQYDLQVMDPIFYVLMVIDEIFKGADPTKICLAFGAAVGFASMDYPQVTVPIAGATISVLPPSLKVVYLSESGTGDPSLTETTAIGAFYVVVPDATAIPGIALSGSKPGTQLVGALVATRPGGFVPAGVIDPFFVP